MPLSLYTLYIKFLKERGNRTTIKHLCPKIKHIQGHESLEEKNEEQTQRFSHLKEKRK